MDLEVPATAPVDLPGYEVSDLLASREALYVCRGIRQADGLPVILKLPSEGQPDPDVVTLLTRDYEMAQRAAGSGVIRVYGLEQHQGRPVLVLEDFGGQSLNRIVKHRALPIVDVLRIGICVATGLGDIHGANIIHKDINPSNIVYNPDTGVAKIIDFGIATAADREQQAAARLPSAFQGSLPYMAPEQTGRMNRPVDYRADFYALGATLFELLTHRPLFGVSDAIEWFHCHIAKQPRPPAEIDPSIPRAVSDIIMKLLSKTAEERYQSALGIRMDLQRCLDEVVAHGSVRPFALGAGDVPVRFQIPQRLYGREREVSSLLDCFRRASQGRSEMLLVSGYSGIGKTRVIREIHKPITERRGYFGAGKFDQLHRDIPYSGLIAALRDLVRQLLTESDERLGAWKANILRAIGSNGRLLTDGISELELIIGPQPRLPALAPLPAERRLNRVFQSFIQLFCRPEHPLVLFLDDLQWADSASLKLVDLLMRETEFRHLLVIGAYRDNEVSEGHPLLSTLTQLRQQGVAVSEIKLRPLDRGQLTQLLAETLLAEPQRVAPLAELVERKTAGNPFFVEEFLKFLHKQGLIGFDAKHRRWGWELAQIRAQHMTDNVVQLMADKLESLGAATQTLLELAACIGGNFNLSLLAQVTGDSPAAVAQRLREALREGVIVAGADMPAGRGKVQSQYAFAHDRVQQAAYSLLSGRERQVAHLTIGRLLLEKLRTNDQSSFNIANHLNLARELITDPAERIRLSQLNLTAGRRAKGASAYLPAFAYLRAGLDALPADSWQSHYELALDLHVDAAEAAYLSGQYEAMDGLLNAGLSQARNLLDRVRLHEIQMAACIARGQLYEAIDIALPLLRELGHEYPKKPNRRHFKASLAELRSLLQDRPLEELRNLPEMKDPYQQAARRIVSRMGGPVYLVQPQLFPLLAFDAVKATLQYGHHVLALTNYASFGTILCATLGDIDSGQTFGRLALELTERLQAKQAKPRVLHVYTAFIRHWKEPLHTTLEALREVHRLGLETGDFEFAAHANNIYTSHAFGSGMPLDRYLDEMTACRQAVAQLIQGPLVHYAEAAHQLALNLVGQSADPRRLVGASYDIDTMLPRHTEAGDRPMQLYAHLLSLQLACFFGDYRRGLSHADAARSALGSALGQYITIAFHYYDALLRLGICTTASREERRQLLRAVAADQARMRSWAAHNPATCESKVALIEAERLRVLGRHLQADAHYDRAIRLAQAQGFVQEEALASELAGHMHLAAGRLTVAEAYLRKAHGAYSRWGAHGKVADLEELYPGLVGADGISSVATTTRSTTGTSAADSVDVHALVKALKAIAAEPVHSKMLETIIATAIELAGAQHGMLILRTSKGGLCIEAEASVDGGQPRILQSLPVAHSANLSQAVVNYVARTQSPLVIHDAAQPSDEIPGLHLDPYIRDNQVRSVLCLPILAGSESVHELIGMLYVENNRASKTFTQQQFGTLEIICLSAAGRLELSRRAAVDGLTQLFNHDYFQNMLHQEFVSARRHGRELSLIFADIDHFKSFNDTWGHQVGDQVLREVAGQVRSCCRDADVVARYGGEEIAIILREAGGDAAAQVAERIRQAVARTPLLHDGNSLQVTVSLGVASLRASTSDKEALLREADSALYLSKHKGRNRVTVV